MPARKATSALVIAAGLGLCLGVSQPSSAVAQPGAADTPVVGEYASPDYVDQVRGESSGETKLYVIGRQDNLVTSEGAADENIKVSIPVAIHYVADTEGNLVGPSDNMVKFVNHTKLGSVHVSRIAVENAGDAKIMLDSNGLQSDQMSFFVRPVAGASDEQGNTFAPDTTAGSSTKDELGRYASRTHDQAISPANKNEWNIAQQHGALALNDLTGRIGGFDKMDPSTNYKVGAIHWTVRAGTRAQADASDSSVTIHFNANNGSNANHQPVPDQRVAVLQADKLPDRQEREEGMNTPIAAGASDVIAPSSVVNSEGSASTQAFVGWNTRADGSGEFVQRVCDLGNAQDIAGTVRELYAIYRAS